MSSLKHLPAYPHLVAWAAQGSIPPLRCGDCGAWLPRKWSHEEDSEDGRPAHIKYAVCGKCGSIVRRYA